MGSTSQLPGVACCLEQVVTVVLLAVAVDRVTLDVEVRFETSVIAVITSRGGVRVVIRPAW
jgi:hypothetical protein